MKKRATIVLLLLLAFPTFFRAERIKVRALVESYTESKFEAFLADGRDARGVSYMTKLILIFPTSVKNSQVTVFVSSPLEIGHALREIDEEIEFMIDEEILKRLEQNNAPDRITGVRDTDLRGISIYEETAFRPKQTPSHGSQWK